MARSHDAVIRYHIPARGSQPNEAQATTMAWDGDISDLRVNFEYMGYEGQGPAEAPVDHSSGRITGDVSFYMLAHDWMRPDFWGLKLAVVGWWFYEQGIGSGRVRFYLPSKTTVNVRARGQHTFYEPICTLHGDPNFEPQA